MKSATTLRDNLSAFIIIIFPSLFILGTALLNIFTLTFVLLNIDRLFFFLKNKSEKLILFSFFFFVIYCFFVSLFAIDVESSIRRSLSFFLKGMFFFTLWSFSYLEFNHKKFIKYLMISVFLLNTFVLIDTTIQFFFGRDLFNFEAHRYRLSGPFNDEYIVGSFLYKFSLLSIPSILILFKKKTFFVIFYIAYSFTIVMLSGERASLLLFSFGLFISLFFIDKVFLKKYLKYFIIFLILVLLTLMSVFKTENIKLSKMTDVSYLDNIRSEITEKKLTKEITNLNYRVFWIFDRLVVQTSDDIKSFQHSSYFILYESALKTWKNNKYFGVGLKNFRIFCQNIKLESNKNNYPKCSTHPHNYVLEILAELGLIGLLLFLIFIYTLTSRIFLSVKINKSNYKFLLHTLSIILITIMFPLIPTGSFFSSFNTSFFWYFLSLLFYINGLSEKKN